MRLGNRVRSSSDRGPTELLQISFPGASLPTLGLAAYQASLSDAQRRWRVERARPYPAWPVSRDLASSHGSFPVHANAVVGYGLATPLALASAGKRGRRPPERCLPQQGRRLAAAGRRCVSYVLLRHPLVQN